MHLHYVPVLITLFFSPCLVFGGKVLVFPMDGSHWLSLRILVEELHSRGHEITVIRPQDSWFIQEESPYYQTINVKPMSSSETKMVNFAAKMVNMAREGASIWNRISVYLEMFEYFYQKLKNEAEVVGEMFENQELMQKLRDANYDLVLTDPVLGSGVLMAHRLGLPLVLLARWTFLGDGHFAIAPSPLSYVPIPGSELSDKMTFIERFQNLFSNVINSLGFWYMVNPVYKPFVHHYFGSDVHYIQLFQAADLWLMRNDFTLEFPRPTMPNVVYIAGYQCKPSKPLSKDLEDFVQSSGEHGVIIMSLGTLVAQLPEDLVEEFAAAFAKLPQKVIWRHKGKKPSTLGNNTLLVDWLPQKDLLGHPKTKVFVAHGGTNGIQEAVYHGVPLVGLPLMYDQHDNFFRMKVRGVAKVLDIATVNRDNFFQALKEVLYEPSYREKMKALSHVHRDTPLKPLDTAVFWVEFVMRHKGAKHLRTESYKLSMIQYYCIDVVVFMLAATSLVIITLITTLMFLWRCLFPQRKIKSA